jgi:hypothetical protein
MRLAGRQMETIVSMDSYLTVRGYIAEDSTLNTNYYYYYYYYYY